MSIVTVSAKSKTYPIYIEQDFAKLGEAFAKAGLAGRKAMLVTDDNVAGFYLDKVTEILKATNPACSSFVFPAGEASKNLHTVSEIYTAFADRKLDRKSVVIALGGGVTGDMAGFAAATYMRGIAFVQIPTSLLSQVDSSVGGKTGVDFNGNKNLIGAFYQPELVYINVSTLHTLAESEFTSGMGEVIKHGIIKDAAYLRYIDEHKEAIQKRDLFAVSAVIKGSCQIKAEVVGLDEKEQGMREWLNFGHTFGHSIESLSNFTISHGKCVSIGMAAALYISMKRGGITQAKRREMETLFAYFGLPVTAQGFERDAVYKQMFMDKKAKDDKLTFVLVHKIGDAYTANDVGKEMIFDALAQIVLP